jgi:hypothetical protein
MFQNHHTEISRLKDRRIGGYDAIWLAFSEKFHHVSAFCYYGGSGGSSSDLVEQPPTRTYFILVPFGIIRLTRATAASCGTSHQ